MDARGVYNLAEIWPGFHRSSNISNIEDNVGATPYGVDLRPVLTDQNMNRTPPNRNSKKLRGQNEFARAGDSTSNSNGSSSDNNNEGYNKKFKMATSSENLANNEEGEGNSNKNEEQVVKPAEPPKKDYIHVRARRGQATDSHSLAERARREKISERMKILQDLVPGCNKVIGKALVLDEIINYIQSLQRQVEFLSMKLEAVNTGMGIDGYPPQKDILSIESYAIETGLTDTLLQTEKWGDFYVFGSQQTFDSSNTAFVSQSTREYGRDSSPEWLHMQIGGGFERPS